MFLSLGTTGLSLISDVWLDYLDEMIILLLRNSLVLFLLELLFYRIIFLSLEPENYDLTTYLMPFGEFLPLLSSIFNFTMFLPVLS